MADWVIESLSGTHVRGDFACGRGSLDDFLKQFARQYQKRKIGQTFVAVRPDDPRVIGYYTLAAATIDLSQLPVEQRRKLPKHPVPAMLLGRLAVDRSAQGSGLGAGLLADALDKVLGMSRLAGIYAVTVRALDAAAAAFYRKFGFEPLLESPDHLYLMTATIERSIADIP